MRTKMIWSKSEPLDQLGLVALKVLEQLKETDRFALLLRGDLGAGKTTFARYFFQALGLSPLEPVTSPTYTYLNLYKILGHEYAHMDLYRLGQGSSEDLFEEVKHARGILVEWARVSDLTEHLRDRRLFELSITVDLDEPGFRQYQFSALDAGS